MALIFAAFGVEEATDPAVKVKVMMMWIREVRVSDRKNPDPAGDWTVEVVGADSDRAAIRHVKRTDPTLRSIWRSRRTWRCPFDVRVVGATITPGSGVMLSVDDWRAVLGALDDDQDRVARRILGQLPLDDLWWEGLVDDYRAHSKPPITGERVITRDEAVAWLRQREGDTVSLTVFDQWVSVKGVLRDLSEDEEWLWVIGDVRGSHAWFHLDDSRVECRILDRWASFDAREVRARLGDVPWKDPAQLDDAVERARRQAVREQLLLKLGPTRIAVERDDDDHKDDDDDDDDDDAAGPPPGRDRRAQTSGRS